MLHKPALCMPGHDEAQFDCFRLGVLGFDEHANEYILRARSVSSKLGSELEIVVFVSPDSPEWRAAKIAASQSGGAAICTSTVTAILPVEDAPKSEPQFIIETALGPYPLDDLFLCRSGGALLRQ